MLGNPITTYTLVVAAIGVTMILIWWSVRLVVKVAVAVVFLAAASYVWWAGTGQGPVELWHSVQAFVTGVAGPFLSGLHWPPWR